ncbi:MAG: PilZ domain-containing protein [Coriobacteriia bacterium]|nr:PilZ domain-containing protein [Humidesulfovibrio sp.]MDZ4064526.1 PilZ domain-containing protein [Coriobacteriia bacterium]
MSEAEPQNLPDMTSRFTPGARVFIILHKDPLRERIDVRTSKVLGLEDDVLFLAQTEPPVPREQIGEPLEAALLLEAGQDLRPIGYASRLLNILDDHPLPDHSRMTALAIAAPSPDGFFETSLRMHYRVPVDNDMGVLIRLGGLEEAGDSAQPATPGDADAVDAVDTGDAPDEFDFFDMPALADTGDASDTSDESCAPCAPCVPENPELPEKAECIEAPSEEQEPVLLDFSAGGARVRLPASADVKVGDQLPFKLVFLGSGYADGLGIVRSAERTPDNNALDLGLFFTNMDIRDIRYLERMVARIVSACRQRERDAEYS